MNTLRFPNGSIGALLYNDPPAGAIEPIAIPRDFAVRGVAATNDPQERWVHAAMAGCIAAVVAALAYFVV